MFDGWKLTGGGSLNGNEYTFGASDGTITAQWKEIAPPVVEPSTYTLTVNNGYGGTSTQTGKEGDKITLTTPARTGYTFDGWNLTGGGSLNGNEYTFGASDGTVTARWKAIVPPGVKPPTEYTLTVNNGYGGTSTQTGKEGDKITLTTPAHAGYTFNGWKLTGGGSLNGNEYTFGASDGTATAQWKDIIPGISGDGKDRYVPVSGYKNIYEVVKADGKSYSPARFVYSTDPAAGSGSMEVVPLGGKFYVKLWQADKQQYVYCEVNPATGLYDPAKAIHAGPDGIFGTADDYPVNSPPATNLPPKPGGDGNTPKTGTYRKFIIACPVDIALYDAAGRLLAKTEQGGATAAGSSPKLITIEGDTKIVLPVDSEVAQIRFTAYGAGTMTYTVQDIDRSTGRVLREKVFRNVALVPGKEMHSDITETPNVNLLVMEGGTVIADIREDGTEAKRSPSSNGSGNPFSDGQGNQEPPPKTGVGIDGKMIALMIVILLDVAFMAWLLRKRRWPRLMRPTMALQLPEME